MKHRAIRVAMVITNTLMIGSAGAATAFTASEDPRVVVDAVSVSVPVFITSLIATAAFTWVVAKYDSAREKKLSKLEDEIGKLNEFIRGRQEHSRPAEPHDSE